MATTTVILTTPGSNTWTVPDGVTSIDSVEVWGGGANSNMSNSGGGGGAWSIKNNLSFTPGQVFNYSIGAGGSGGGGGGGDTWFAGSGFWDAQVLAQGGEPWGLGGDAGAGVGDTCYSGGSAGGGAGGLNGGGSAASPYGNGTDGYYQVGSYDGRHGGHGGDSPSAGVGGAGGDQDVKGNPGNDHVDGGGGGGGDGKNLNGDPCGGGNPGGGSAAGDNTYVSTGGRGQVRITYTASGGSVEDGEFDLSAEGVATAAASSTLAGVTAPTASGTLTVSAKATLLGTTALSASGTMTAAGDVPSSGPVVVLLTTTGASTWTVPSGVTSVIVECWGAGGGGATSFGTPGGGGAYSKSTVTVAQNTLINVSIGAGVAADKGGDTWFGSSATVMAKGGERNTTGNSPGGGAAASGGVGTLKYSGGGVPVGSPFGGGGAASSGGNGVNSSTSSGGNAGTGGGAGGASLTVGVSNVEGGGGGGAGANGGAPGGGGGSSASGGVNTTGGRGQIRITYDVPTSGKFGEEIPSGGSTQTTSTQAKWVRPYTVGPVDVQISKITIYVNSVSSGSPEYRPLIYADSSGAPGALVVAGSDVATSATGAVDLPFAPGAAILTANTTYWFGFQRNGATINFPNNVISPPITANTNTDTFSDGPSNPFGSPSSSSSGPPFAAYWADYEPLKFGTFDLSATTSFDIIANVSQGGFDLRGQASFAAFGDIITLGQLGTTPSATGSSGSTSNQLKRARSYTTPALAVQITRLQVYRSAAPAGSEMRGVIYDASGAGGIPGNLVAQGDIVTGTATGLLDLPFSSRPALSASTPYWFGVMKNGQSLGFWNSTATYAQNTDTFSDGASATWGTNSAQASGPQLSVTYQSPLVSPILGFFNLNADSIATFELTPAGSNPQGEFDFDATASATFAGKLTAAGTFAPTGTGNATQTGKLAAQAGYAFSAASNSGNAGRQIMRSGFALSGTGTLTLIPDAVQGGFDFTAASTATLAGSLKAAGIQASSGSSAATFVGGLAQVGAFALSGASSLTIEGGVYILGGFGLSGTSSAVAAAKTIARSGVAFSAQSDFALDDMVVNAGAFALSAESLTTFSGQVALGGRFDLTGSSDSANAGSLRGKAAFGLSASATASASATFRVGGSFSLQGNTALGVDGKMTYRSVGFALTGVSSFKVFLQPTYTPPPKPPRALITIPPSAPTWAHMLVKQINEFFTTPFRPYHPTRLYEVERPQDLPDASKYIHSLVFVVSIKRLAVSDGVNWIRQDTGAAL